MEGRHQQGESWYKGHVESEAWRELCDLGQVTQPLWALVSLLCKTEAKNRVRMGRIWEDTSRGLTRPVTVIVRVLEGDLSAE